MSARPKAQPLHFALRLTSLTFRSPLIIPLLLTLWSAPLSSTPSPTLSATPVPSVKLTSECVTFISKLRASQRDPAQVAQLFAPPKKPRWRYRGAKKKLFSEVAPTAGDGMIEALYTGETRAPNGHKAPSGFNCEHLWPRAWMGGRRDPLFREKEADLHNLFPSVMRVNSRRGHLPFGLVKTPTTDIASPSVIGTSDGRGERIQPRPERRGDVARALVYMASRWQLRWPSPHRDLLIEWSKQDPPDERERRRDERISALQGNGNPLVRCPEALPELLALLKLP